MHFFILMFACTVQMCHLYENQIAVEVANIFGVLTYAYDS